MRHALTGLVQTWKNLALVLDKKRILSWNCPGICKIILENMN